MTTYPAQDAFRDYLEGRGTLGAFRKQPGSVTETLYRDEVRPEPSWVGPFIAGLVLGLAISALACTLLR